MATSLGNSNGGSRLSYRNRRRPMSEINVTPMVDVMLVLLVIFMVTAPLLTVGVTVDLPKTKASVVPGQDEPLAVSVNAEGKVFLQDTELELSGLVPRLKAITGNNPDVRIFVRGDKNVNYGRVMQVMGVVNAAGFRKVALITQRAAPSPRKKKGTR
ncbi:MAG: protein TolR [Rhodospirillaceae bacterium]|jgi:biopolymer transport protein TolR|nr:protein TolR [Rhodospirillaceae bacterium]MBT4219706.1 protein TolR [Rhodospirillaceae bacterium]MBT5014185.1 protein TolR [Rhodospirillaceae bacterium]MBT5307803.1 protein TolR [Rhodospirillaceae bacterium]MBT6407593.1 protein TolR [Rhodospirillaceae bacterium]